ncbi:DUF1800 family protein [Pseudoruegeria sp. HB172150]|uniref:DUF1800 domain-containing protein n=1 Tax=Pseudoruegeria sp. HB172150 TaxID=2721164 RepID=UPI001552EB6F|nr:DUF1800 domain-containing protein [Pseudoruegeria sp. HB172150]
MLFDQAIGPETYAAIRFGYGLPARHIPVEPEAMLRQLTRPDRTAAGFPKMTFAESIALGRDYLAARQDQRAKMDGADEREKALKREIQVSLDFGLAADLARIVETEDPFRERLVHFWKNHFAIAPTARPAVAMSGIYSDHAIRPRVAGRFGDLLAAAVTHPAMLIYLDQVVSVGPNSAVGKKRGRGLNENLAREVLELHTLGVGAAYGQTDVRQFAELLTGLSFNIRKDDAVAFRSEYAEPGAEKVLGERYGGRGRARLEHIREALDDLAVHPATARHLSHKLAAHFVADTPDPALVAAMEAAWLDSGGDLSAVYGTMLRHPAAWHGFGAKVKLPMEFMGSALRALGARGADLVSLPRGKLKKQFRDQLRAMGQDPIRPPGPDGYADAETAWVQPFGLAQRISWAMAAAARRKDQDAEPDRFARRALGDAASPRLVKAVSAAETRAEGVGLVLASAEFNRR